MNIDCRVIGDLLPLYADESCSDASRALVDDHLKTCPRCRETLARMKSEQFLPAAQAIDPPSPTTRKRSSTVARSAAPA